ncbi:pre-mRNA cleavage complex 2 protein Pcf11 isoform X1 [Mus musculus]|uniref:pre-mRNA cleavage complex 2 protein Pcf11 isoform X1 n=1 Tax=Mus musculus TaxID=10090 RepID=UPI0003D73FEA|nr:pre-mRNA cleavage complex 2 protein Pcf11 isoform X1 [Mus musculus]|eukprot:XP_006508335.1 PREDICTED: pre-mRNA cleavage complex 2 protein Pcf11 isoform X1 [Mus musculus]
MSEQTPAEAGAAGAREDACRDYQSSLEDLTFNSKPHINMLTILAEENLPFAKEIVSLIEAQTAKAPSSEKLPVMYLMDSIVKNVGREYLTAFTKNLVATFICVFEKVDENTRKSLFKLRSTWDEIFPLKKLYALDVRVNSLDPAWPIKPLPPNVNTSSIHVNPKFLNKSPDEPSTPGTVVSSPSISTPPIVPDIQKNLTQEQLIRQQLLAKQKQLLELQQKKLELELEQAKAQLAVSLSVQQETANLGPGSVPSKLHVPQIPTMAVKTPHQVPVQPDKSRAGPSLQMQDLKGTNRDPRLNRMSQHSSHGKEQSHRKEFVMNTINQSDIKTSKNVPSEKLNSSKQEKSKSGERITKKELDQLDSKSKSKSKSPSPLKNKLSHTKDLKNQDSESMRLSDMSKRDPRLKKHLQDKAEGKDEDVKEKRKTAEKKEKDEHMKSSEHRVIGSRSKIINGIVQKQDMVTEELEKQGTKPGRSSTRKRSRSRSPKSRSPIIHSPKRRDRRSPKRRQRSMSPNLAPKAGKMRQSGLKQSHMEEFPPPSREERNIKRSAKQDVRDPRRLKKMDEDRPQETAGQHSMKSGGDPKENIENWQSSKSAKRWKSGWEENKSLQQGDEHSKPPHLRHRESWSSTKGILSPRAPKQQHRLSVDANLQIPKELTLASKRELLQKTSERLASGEITQDEFLVVVHQIRQLFQYQEGKHRCNVRDSPKEENKGGLKKKPLLSDAELTYYEHKAKLKRTQVQHSFPRLDLLDPDIFDYPLTDALLSGIECEPSKSKHASRNSGAQFDRKEQFSERARRPSPISGSRTYAENLSPHEGRRRHDEQVSAKGVREEQRSPFNDRFPLKRPRYEDSDKPFVDGPASRFAGLDTNQRLTALAEDRPLFDGPGRPSVTRDGPAKMIFEGPNKLSPRIDGPPTPGSLRFDGSPGQMGGGGPMRFEGPQGQLGGGCPLRFEGPPGPVGTPLRFEGPIGQGGGGGFRFEGSPSLRFEGSTGGLRFEGPGGQPVGGLRFEGHRGQPVGGLRFEGPHGQPVGSLRFDNPRGQPVGGLRFEGGHGPSGAAIRFDGPHGQPGGGGGIRFEGPLLQQGVGMRFEGPHGQSVAGLRFEGHNQLGGNLRFEGPHGQPGVGIRFEGPIVQQGGGMRFEGPVPGGGLRIEGPLGQGGPRFEGCHSLRFDGQPGQPSLLPRFDGLHGQPGPRFERTGQPGPQRFDGPPGQQVQPRFDGVPQRFDGPQHQQASRFDIPLGLQGTRFDNHPSQRIESFNHSGPYNDPPGNTFNVPSQGLQFQRHEQIFDTPQGPNFNGPHGPGNQNFPNPINRASGHYFDEKNLQSSQFGNFGNLPTPISVGNIQASQQVLTGVAQPVAFGQGQQFLPVHPQNPGAFIQNPSGGLPKAYPDNHLSQVDVNELFSKLLKTGILKLSQPDSATAQVTEAVAQPPPEEDEDQNEDQDVPDLTNFTIEELKQRYDSVINRLYTGIQCYSCGMRFTTSQTDVYADHLDWHYRQNRTEKDVSRKVTHRRWYYSLTDWIEFEEIADLEERAKSQFFEKVHEEVVLKTQEAAKEKEFQSVPAGPAGAVESCEICQEQFEQYWDEEEEEWHLKNAIRVDGKIYHPSCYEDYQNTSSFDCTPSPSKTPVENPLNIMLNIVKNELQEPCESPKVKEEQIDAPPACSEESVATPTEIKTESDTVESV